VNRPSHGRRPPALSHAEHLLPTRAIYDHGPRSAVSRLSGGIGRRGFVRSAARAAGTQPRHWAQRGWQRRPPRNAPNVCSCLRVVGDPWKPPAQLDSSRQLSLLIENGADRSSISLGDDEHPKSMAVRTTAGKRHAHYPYVGERTLSDIERRRASALRTAGGRDGDQPPFVRVNADLRIDGQRHVESSVGGYPCTKAARCDPVHSQPCTNT
jgi:hypothetical protein